MVEYETETTGDHGIDSLDNFCVLNYEASNLCKVLFMPVGCIHSSSGRSDPGNNVSSRTENFYYFKV